MAVAGFGEEKARFGASDAAEDLLDMLDLPARYTGLAGTVFISTAMGSHRPRVKGFPGNPGPCPPCLTLMFETPPSALDQGLPAPVAREGERLVRPWPESNRDTLLRFRREGTSWNVDDVRAFVLGLSLSRVA